MEGEINDLKVFCKLVSTVPQRMITTVIKQCERQMFLSSVSGLLALGDCGCLGGCPKRGDLRRGWAEVNPTLSWEAVGVGSSPSSAPDLLHGFK